MPYICTICGKEHLTQKEVEENEAAMKAEIAAQNSPKEAQTVKYIDEETKE